MAISSELMCHILFCNNGITRPLLKSFGTKPQCKRLTDNADIKTTDQISRRENAESETQDE